jgi:adenylate cyclase
MERHGTPDIHRFGWATGVAARFIALAGRVGADPLGSGDAALQRRLLVLMCVGTLPLTALWSVTYFSAGVPLAASAPAVTPVNTGLLGWTRNFRFYRFTQLLMTLVLPWVVMMSLGGFKESSVVIIWAALCPIVSLLVGVLRQTVLWIVGFVLLPIVSAILQTHLTRSELPEAFVTWFFVLNLGSVIVIVFALLYYFVGQRNFFQERSETLLLNILPKEISEALKTAAHYESASVLLADVVSFTPMAAAMTPLRVVNLLNDVFHCFDDLAEKYDVEKIKTIGDCYMVAAGCQGSDQTTRQPSSSSRSTCGRRWRARHSGTRNWPSALASTPGRWWPASSAARSLSMISGPRPKIWRAVWNPTARAGSSRSPGAPTI